MTGGRENLIPFEKGNAAALRHGAYSPEVVRPLAEELTAELAEVAPWTSRPPFERAVAAWAWAESQAHLLRTYLAEHGALDGKGQPRPFLDELHRAELRAHRLRAELGLTPKAWAGLVQSMAQAGGDQDSIEALKAEGRAILEAGEGT